MGYVVIESFSDIEDNSHLYIPGDVFPRYGLTVSRERLYELSTNNNKLGRVLIKSNKIVVEPVKVVKTSEPVVEVETPKKTRGRKKKN